MRAVVLQNFHFFHLKFVWLSKDQVVITLQRTHSVTI